MTTFFIGACGLVSGDDRQSYAHYEGVRTVYAEGESIEARLVNKSDELVHVRTLCNYLGLEKRLNGRWKALYQESNACDEGFSVGLEPDREMNVSVPYSHLKETTEDANGTYWFSSRLFLGDHWEDGWTVTSVSFTIE